MGTTAKSAHLGELAVRAPEGLRLNPNDLSESRGALLAKRLHGRLEASCASSRAERPQHPDQLRVATGERKAGVLKVLTEPRLGARAVAHIVPVALRT